MPTSDVLENAEKIVLEWLAADEDGDSPAGPLFTGGKFAEADIIGASLIETRGTCSSCTASRTTFCC
jgi:hypothetical protein